MQNELKSVHCDLLQRTEAFFVSQYIRNRSSIDSAHIFSDNSREVTLFYANHIVPAVVYIIVSNVKQTDNFLPIGFLLVKNDDETCP